MSLKRVKLYGDMGKRFGRVFRLDVANPAEAIRALCVILPGFRQYLQDHLESPFQVLIGKDAQDENGLLAPVGKTECIKIVPVVAGAKSGLGQILLGAVLIGAAFMTGGTSLAWMAPMLTGMGTSMVLGGVAQLLAPNPNTNFNPSADRDKETFSFGSPTLTTGQGGGVPLGYGRMMVGGHIISAGVDRNTWVSGGFDKAVCTTDDGTRYGNGNSVPWLWAIAP